MKRLSFIIGLVALLLSNVAVATNTSTADPTYPQSFIDIDSEPLRNQFDELINDIDNLWAAIQPNFLEANQILGALISGKAIPLSVPSCFSPTNAITWRPGLGFGCNDIQGGGGGTLGPAQALTVIAGPISGTAAVPTAIPLTGDYLPLPSANSIGGVKSASAAAHQFMTGIATSGSLLFSTPSFSDISGTLGSAQLPTPSASSPGGVESIAVIPHNFMTGISLVGAPTQAQPSFADISGNISMSQIASGSGASSSTILHGDGTWSGVSGTVAVTNGDSNFSIPSNSSLASTTTTLSASRTWTLPAASALPTGGQVCISDKAGGVSQLFPLSITATGSDTITPNGQTSFALNNQYQSVCLKSDGASVWDSGSLSPLNVLNIPVASNTFNCNPQNLLHVRYSIAKARQGLGSSNWLLIGDSTMTGAGAGGDIQSVNYPGQLAKALSQSVNTRIAGFFGFKGVGIDSRVGWGTGWSTSAPGFAGSAATQTGTSTSPLTYTSYSMADTFTVYYDKCATCGTFTVDINGSGTQTINSVQAGAPPGGLGNTTITASGIGANVLNTKYVSGGAGSINIQGIVENNSLISSINIINAGWSGSTTSSFINDGGFRNTPQGIVAANQAATLIRLGVNDSNNGVTVASYIANLQTIINSLSSLSATNDIILLGFNPYVMAGTQATQQAFINAERGLALKNNICMLDDFDRWQGGTSPAGVLFGVSAGLHPNNFGYADEASADAKVLAGP